LFAVAIRIAAPQTHILAAIERVEIYTQQCSTLDSNCVQIDESTIALEEDASHELNLMHHLLGNVPQFDSPFTPIKFPSHFTIQVIAWHWHLLPTAIFHPPNLIPKQSKSCPREWVCVAPL
jgi:hypothetical protein